MVDAKQPDTAITRADAARRPTVFLSYGRVDRAAAEGLARALERAGVSAWWDSLIEGGAQFTHLSQAIRFD